MKDDRTDTGADMRGDRPAYRKVVDGIGHDRISVAIATDEGRRPAGIANPKPAWGRHGQRRAWPHGHRVQPVRLEAELFFKAPRTPLIAGAGAGIETVG